MHVIFGQVFPHRNNFRNVIHAIYNEINTTRLFQFRQIIINTSYLVQFFILIQLEIQNIELFQTAVSITQINNLIVKILNAI